MGRNAVAITKSVTKEKKVNRKRKKSSNNFPNFNFG